MADKSVTFLPERSVAAALCLRAGRTTDAEIRRVSKALARLRPAAAEALREDSDPADRFDEALRALADV